MLKALKIPFIPGRPPKVLRAYIDQRGGLKKSQEPEKRPGYWPEPDFSVFQNRVD